MKSEVWFKWSKHFTRSWTEVVIQKQLNHSFLEKDELRNTIQIGLAKIKIKARPKIMLRQSSQLLQCDTNKIISQNRSPLNLFSKHPCLIWKLEFKLNRLRKQSERFGHNIGFSSISFWISNQTKIKKEIDFFWTD